MKVLFDHQAFAMQTHGGVSRCFAQLYSRFVSDSGLGVDARFSVNETDNVYLRRMGIGSPVRCEYDLPLIHDNLHLRRRLLKVRSMLKYGIINPTCSGIFGYKGIESVGELKKGNFDIFHPTFYDDYFLQYLGRKPFVLTIHDMIPEMCPDSFDKDNDFQIIRKRKLAPLASAIVTVSENTKEDVIRILGIREDKIHVIYHGHEHINCSGTGACSPEIRQLRPYVLYVGNRYAYKNFVPFIASVTQVLRKRGNLKVVCTGNCFNETELDIMESYGIKDRVIHRWVQTDEELQTLYGNAECFIYPSRYEGFGIPILEAYKAGCPVLLNNTGSFPEVAGDAAVYFNFSDGSSNLAEKLEMLLSMTPEQRAALLDRQRHRLQLFSWKESAEKLSEVYRNIL